MTSIPAAPHEHSRLLRAGVNIELVTIIWMVIEAAVAIGAGVLAHSVLLTAFGIDSVIELVTGGVLLWRLLTEARAHSLAAVEQAENRAAWVAGLGLALLCVYVVVTALAELLIRNKPETSLVGIGLSLIALLIMPILAWRKRTIAAAIGSAALRGDAACSITCAYLSATLLVGLGLNTMLGWWWADGVASLILLYWLVPEAREALDNAHAGRAGCACGDEHCS
ncbi:MAG: cation transporter [Herpetosiphonaceae bacterium]|nr:cation transporter [Herpetosiphonaceae bacterium]